MSIKISLKFIHEGPNNNIPALVQRMAWRMIGIISMISVLEICSMNDLSIIHR